MRKITILGILFFVIEIILLISLLIFNNTIFISYLTLLLIIHVFSIFSLNSIKLTVVREVSPVLIFLNDVVHVKLKFVNEGSDLPFIHINEHIDAKLRGDYKAVIGLKRNQQCTLEYIINCNMRGRFKLGPLIIKIYDPFLLSYKEIIIPSNDIIVLPRFEFSGWSEAKTRISGVWPGSFVSKDKGESIEFRDVRSYVPGDSFKRVNWKLTAKYDKFMINEFESEKITNLLIILDVSGLSEDEEQMLDTMVNIASSLAYTLIRTGNRVGIICHGGERRWVFPGYGKMHLIKILEALSLTSLSYEIPLSTIVENLVELIIHPGSLILLITPLISIDILKVASILKAKGYKLAVISPVETNGLDMDLLGRIRNIEKLNNLLWISKYGRVILYYKDMPIKILLAEALK